MFDLSVLLLIWSFMGVLLGVVLVGVDCSDEECTDSGAAQLVLALGGFLLALGAFLASKLHRWRPGIWLAATGGVWVVWLLFVLYFSQS